MANVRRAAACQSSCAAAQHLQTARADRQAFSGDRRWFSRQSSTIMWFQPPDRAIRGLLGAPRHTMEVCSAWCPTVICTPGSCLKLPVMCRCFCSCCCTPCVTTNVSGHHESQWGSAQAGRSCKMCMCTRKRIQCPGFAASHFAVSGTHALIATNEFVGMPCIHRAACGTLKKL